MMSDLIERALDVCSRRQTADVPDELATLRAALLVTGPVVWKWVTYVAGDRSVAAYEDGFGDPMCACLRRPGLKFAHNTPAP